MTALAGVWFFPIVSGCDTSHPTSAVLSNQYPPASEVGAESSTSVYKGFWLVAQFPEPVAAGQVSDAVRIVPGNDYGYALLSPDWEIASGSPATTLIAIRSARKLGVGRGELLTFVVSPDDTVGDCRAGKPLSQDEADYITSRIFPGEFAGLTYDAQSCASSLSAGREAGTGGASGSP